MKASKILPFYLMDNVIQNYDWGSRTSMSTLFDIPNSENKPQAEIWMGAHPGGCSTIFTGSQSQLLSDFITENISEVLDPTTIQDFGGLPYLFKVLAAEKALSIQVHPSKTQAKAGFEKENQLGIDITAYNRNYKDPNHKPELVYALTEYHALNGFRPYQEIIDTFSQINITQLEEPLNQFCSNPTESGLKQFFAYILKLNDDDKSGAIKSLMNYAKKNAPNDSLSSLILSLERQYSDDLGLFSCLMLHHIVLQPGDAMYLEAQTPHAYLKGTGLEVMANSDNVLRAGLTPKYIDVDELIKCTAFIEKPKSSLLFSPQNIENQSCYTVPVQDFNFSLYNTPDSEVAMVDSAEIIFALDSEVLLTHPSGAELTVDKGKSAFIPYSSEKYSIKSNGRVARVYNN